MNHFDRLSAIRDLLRERGVDALLVPRADEHLGEYVPPGAERLAWLTGFTGSAGLAVVLAERAAVFTDGRYTLQLAAETDGALWERRHLVEEPPAAWLAAAAPGGRVGYSPWLHSEEGLRPFVEAGLALAPLEPNPVDVVWAERPGPPMGLAVAHGLEFAGVGAAEKREGVAAELRRAGQDAAVLSDPASIAWLLNIRGADLVYTPVALGFALVFADGGVALFMAGEKVPAETRAWLGEGVRLREPGELGAALGELGGKRVRVDGAGSPAWFAERLREAGAVVVAGGDPCLLPKAAKNAVEQEGARAAHRRDGVAVCRFLRWVEEAEGETECSAAARLVALRGEVQGFWGESFPAISGAGEHGAVIHYRADAASDRAIGRDEVYLIDSGGQYRDGTTDVTRTVWRGPGVAPGELRERFTRVLKGHIALAGCVFPQGVGGPHLDAMARRALWDVGLDYDHGTGHGVGSFLSVHEGPASVSRAGRMVALAAGMIVSDEPGYYEPGAYGIRLENLLLVQQSEIGVRKAFLRFETLTLAPFDRRLIEMGLLSGGERRWVDAYHARVWAEIGPGLEGADRDWLREACRQLDV